MVLRLSKGTYKLFLLQMSITSAHISLQVGNLISQIEDEEKKEIVQALIKHRLRIGHTTYYRKISPNGEGFDPDQLEIIAAILNEHGDFEQVISFIE